jgi:hypothetical protein
MTSIPSHCLAALVVGTGATIAATSLHDGGHGVPKTCIASSLVGSAAVVAAVSHHAEGSPSTICVVGGLGGAGLIGFAISAHASFAKVPRSCKLYTAAGLAVLLAGVRMFAKK